MRRADLPIAYSEGFSPHPKVSFPDALPLGYESTGEYAELQFGGPIALESAIADLNAAFPDGMAVLDAVEVEPGTPKLSKWLQASVWDIQYPVDVGEAAAALMTADTLPVDRDRKGEVTVHDLRPALHRTGVHDGRVRVIAHHVEPPMRPSEVHFALAAIHPDLPQPALVTRVAQGEPIEEGLREAISGDLIPPSDTARNSDPRDSGTAGPRAPTN